MKNLWSIFKILHISVKVISYVKVIFFLFLHDNRELVWILLTVGIEWLYSGEFNEFMIE